MTTDAERIERAKAQIESKPGETEDRTVWLLEMLEDVLSFTEHVATVNRTGNVIVLTTQDGDTLRVVVTTNVS